MVMLGRSVLDSVCAGICYINTASLKVADPIECRPLLLPFLFLSIFGSSALLFAGSPSRLQPATTIARAFWDACLAITLRLRWLIRPSGKRRSFIGPRDLNFDTKYELPDARSQQGSGARPEAAVAKGGVFGSWSLKASCIHRLTIR